jgi:hypothetical protein
MIRLGMIGRKSQLVNPGQIYPLFIFHVEKFRSFRIYMLQLQLESDKERVEVYTPKEAHKNLPQW